MSAYDGRRWPSALTSLKILQTDSRMSHDTYHEGSQRRVAWTIVAVVIAYLGAGSFGWPQLGTQQIVDASSHHGAEHSEPAGHSGEEDAAEEGTHQETAEPSDHGMGEASVDEEEPSASPPLWMVLPFALLLAAIAVLPLIPATETWWESNWHRFLVAAGLGVVTLAYYALMHHAPMEGHWPAHHEVESGAGPIAWGFVWTVFANAIMHEYIPFIVLLFSLFTISGGIRIEGDLQANPLTNASFMAIGGVLASFIGTTGAAMLLIRPLLETNSERKHVRHTVVFFIFIVCNCGGCLLPIGDPPLFLGYLRGVPFLWTFGLIQQWAFVNGLLLVIYCVLDQFVFYPRETVADIRRDITQRRKLTFQGLKANAILLAGVVLAVALLDPSKPFPGTDWHPWLYLREIVQVGLVAISLLVGSQAGRRANQFNYHAIIEVAALFCGIFICMQPALQILREEGDKLGVNSPVEFFWYTGGLSSVLDNAPTYVVFFETAKIESAHEISNGTADAADLVAETGVLAHLLVAISLGAVFMGAMTYIGNGPNFMVKAIAEKSGVKMPSFFGYMVYSVLVLLPVLGLTTWCFLMPG